MRHALSRVRRDRPRRLIRFGGLDRLEGRVVPAVLTVLNTGDSGAGSLRAAITQADLDTTPDTIQFAPTVTGTILLATALPDLSSAITIDGPGASALTVARTTATGMPAFRIFTVPAGVGVTISGLTVKGGQSFASEGGGGGIANAGTMTVANCVVSGNECGNGNLGGSGGGIANSGVMTVTDSTVTQNQAVRGDGGGIVNTGVLTVSGSTISGNQAVSILGGGHGGGILNVGTLTVTNSTIAGNTADFNGGAIDTNSVINAGLLTTTITDSTLSGNTASQGGGVFMEVDQSGADTVAKVQNSIFHNPQGGNFAVSMAGQFVSLGHNLFSDNPGLPLDPTDLADTDPLLAPLADNGGPTQTLALLPGSPAIDAGVPVAVITADQRGIPRPQGSAPDIGAFESRGFDLALVGGSGQSASGGSAFPSPLVVKVSSPFSEPVAGGRVTFSAPTTGPSAGFSGNPAAIDADGLASADATANGLGGTYTVTAGASGARPVALTLTNTVTVTTTLLTSSPNPSVAGRPALFIATLFPTGVGTPTGVVTFTVDGVAQPPVPLGQGQAVFVATGLGIGIHTVTAAYGGDPDFAPSVSNSVVQVVNPAPAVVLVRRVGIHAQPTRLVLAFNRPTNAATVQDLRSYLLHPAGPRGNGGPHPRPIPIASAVYDPVQQTVTLTPKFRLGLRDNYLLTVSGLGTYPLLDNDDIPLAGTGTGGLPGDETVLIHGFGPWSPTTSAAHVAKAKALPAGPLFRTHPTARR